MIKRVIWRFEFFSKQNLQFLTKYIKLNSTFESICQVKNK